MHRTLIKTLLGATALGLLVTNVANATPLSGSFGITVWYGSNPTPHLSTDPQEQALPTNPIATNSNKLYSGTYTGQIDFSQGGSGDGDILTFLLSAGGGLSGGPQQFSLLHIMSTGGFSDATLIEFSFTVSTAITGTITHDDGISIYNATNTTALVDSSAPTSATPTTYTLAPGNYNLWYAEVNGLPAVLDFEAATVPTRVPEPGSLVVIGAGLIAAGVLRHRKTAKAPS